MKSKSFLIWGLLLIALCLSGQVGAKPYELQSPNGKLSVVINDGGRLTYQVSFAGQLLMEPSAIGMKLMNGKVIGENLRLTSPRVRKKTENISSPFYRVRSFTTTYNEADFRLGYGFGVIFRAYDEGIAYRFYTTQKKETTIADEIVEVKFVSDYPAYISYALGRNTHAMSYKNIYELTPLSKALERAVVLPMTVDCEQVKVTLMESDLEAYPDLFVMPNGQGVKGAFTPYQGKDNFIAKSAGARNYPWRILAVSQRDTEMPTNNLVYALASPNRIGDTSWIEPGKSAWDWWNDWNLRHVPFKTGMNMDTYKYYIDFASDYGLEYITIDEGWYPVQSKNMMASIPELNIRELVDYGKSKGVFIMIWAPSDVLDADADRICQKYADMGAKGFKVNFGNRHDQTTVEAAYRIAQKCAEYHLLLNYHGFYKPTGLNRTFPNILNIESVFGLEEMKWTNIKKDMPLYDVTFPYIRMMAGPVDYTPGAMLNASKKDWNASNSSPMSMGTRAHQLAAFIVQDAPLMVLADSPTNYQREEECMDFIASIPNEADSTFIASGEIGKYIVSVRKKDINWYVGGMTNWKARDVVVDLSFLPKQFRYAATIFKDGLNVDRNAEDYQVEKVVVSHQSTLNMHMASGGGFAIKLEVCPVRSEVTAVPKGKGIHPFYKKYIETEGLYVTSSDKVADEALLKACDILSLMLSKRPDVKAHMVEQGCHVMIIGRDEETCDIPEFAHICTTPDSIKFWNWRARGFGGAPEDTYSASCGEENVLALRGDRYVGENILIHEFSHLIHQIGIAEIEPDFNDRLETIRQHALAKGLWSKTYGIGSKEEYFAECVQSFFNCNRYSETANGVHNWVNRRVKLKNYDPEMYALLKEYFYEIDIPIYNEIHR